MSQNEKRKVLDMNVLIKLNSVSSQCARGKPSIARKPEDHPKVLSGKKTFQKRNPPDFKFYPCKLTDTVFPHIV